MPGPVRHVYILGAGFSLPLGGPLFGDLLSMRLKALYDYKFSAVPPDCNQEYWNLVRGFPRIIMQALEHEHGVSPLQLNAEEILEYAELLCSHESNFLTNQIFNLASQYLPRENRESYRPELFRLLKARLAMETHFFLEDLAETSERWIPYDNWYSKLDSNDTIITTNYDLVMETLESRYCKAIGTALPQTCDIAEIGTQRRQRGPYVYKLHGSIDWFEHEDRAKRRTIRNSSELIHKDILIGTPGLAKAELARSLLRDQWKQAMIEVEQCNVLSMVGYSLPATDNFLRTTLLDQIAKNTRLRLVNIILGDRNERGNRAKSVLKQSVRNRDNTNGREVKVLLPSVYAQDFLPKYLPISDDEILAGAFPE